MKLLIIVVLVLVATLPLYASCVAAGRADDQAEIMYREFERRKNGQRQNI